MNMLEFLALSVGMYGNGEYLDKICDNFNIDPDENEVLKVLEIDNKNFGNMFADHLFCVIIEKACEELKLDRDKFDYICNGSLDTTLYYDGNAVDSWDGLVEIAEEQ